jgi:hypothetical protein
LLQINSSISQFEIIQMINLSPIPYRLYGKEELEVINRLGSTGAYSREMRNREEEVEVGEFLVGGVGLGVVVGGGEWERGGWGWGEWDLEG